MTLHVHKTVIIVVYIMIFAFEWVSHDVKKVEGFVCILVTPRKNI